MFAKKQIISKTLVILGTTFFITWIGCTEVIFERASEVYCNPKYAINPVLYIKRLTRKGNYALYIEGTVVTEWNNNVTVHADFYEKLSNEYKKSFVSMQFKLCDGINRDPYIGKMLANTGLRCPLKPGRYYLHNMSLPSSKVKYIWPFKEGRVDVELNTTLTHDVVCHGKVYIFLKPQPKTPKLYNT